MPLSGAVLALLISGLLALMLLVLVGALALSPSTSFAFGDAAFTVLMFSIILAVPLFILLAVTSASSSTAERYANHSAKRQFWLGINSFEISSVGLTAIRTYSTTLIRWKKVKEIYLLDEAIHFLMGTKQTNIVLIPLSAFESREQIDETLGLIRRYWHGEIKTG